MSFIVVGSPLDLPGPHRQKWLGAIKCLNLALFIDTQDQRKVRWVEIEPNDIAQTCRARIVPSCALLQRILRWRYCRTQTPPAKQSERASHPHAQSCDAAASLQL